MNQGFRRTAYVNPCYHTVSIDVCLLFCLRSYSIMHVITGNFFDYEVVPVELLIYLRLGCFYRLLGHRNDVDYMGC